MDLPSQTIRRARKRSRTAVSCGHCRVRKLKCSRTSPCDSCLRTGDAASCSYEAPRDPMSTDALTARIDRLEGLLLSAVSSNNQRFQVNENAVQSGLLPDSKLDAQNTEIVTGDSGAKDIETEELVSAAGILKIDQAENKTLYIGGSHWVSIMSEIEEFRNYLVNNHESLEKNALELRALSRDVRKTPSLLRGIATPASREEIISYLPSPEVVEMLVDRFFTTYGLTIPIIHEPTFRKEVMYHWCNPEKTKVVWFALLFAMLHLAELSNEITEKLGTRLSYQITGIYKTRTIQCLIASDYTDPVGYTIEALMLYIEAEWISAQDLSIETSIILGSAIRLAMRMGIHRNSSNYSLTPFQSEMRRRLWAVIYRADTLYSFQLSLPPNIRQQDCDCGLPRNIKNEDFGEMTDLPPEKPLEEPTEVAYLITKHRLLTVLGNVIEFVNDNSSLDGKFKELEESLHEARKMIPLYLQLSDPEPTSFGPLGLIMHKIGLDRVYQLSKCLLHRKFLRRDRNDPTTISHRESCISAALILLAHQSSIFLDFDSMYPQIVRERHMFTLMSHDFFVAGMAVALELQTEFEAEPVSQSPGEAASWGHDRRDEMIAALETSTEFWRIAKEESVEAAKAFGLFSFVLRRVKMSKQVGGESMRSDNGYGEVTGLNPLFVDSEPLGEIPEIDWELWEAHNGTWDLNNESML